MSRQYTRDHIKISTVKILQTLGWNSINSAPLEILGDILGNYIQQISRSVNSYANEFGCTQPNLDHLGLTFRDMGINVGELEEYVKYVNFGPAAHPVPKYPLPKEDHLNFLKPGSKEVVTRPVHIHEHLPPMNPLLEGNENDSETIKVEELDEASVENSQVFKKPSDIAHVDYKRPSFRKEEEGSRPTREISSVMMTTSGFLSPAREGKLPESRTPISSIDPVLPPAPVPEVVEPVKKPLKVINKKIEKKKIKQSPYPEPGNLQDEKRKRVNSINMAIKSKMKAILGSQNLLNPIPPNYDVPREISPAVQKARQAAKMNKALAAARLKTEKLNTTITPIPMKTVTLQQPPAPESDNVDKLFTEPDKKKVNILKKISNVKNEKGEGKGKKDEQLGSCGSSPDLVIDEPDEIVSKLSHLPSDVTIEPINSVTSVKSPEKIDTTPYFDDDSQPGTPSTPKTPEMISHSPPTVNKEKRRKKDSRRIKKLQKHQSPHRIDTEAMDIEMERPKTPEAQGLSKMELPLPPISQIGHGANLPFPFLTNFGGPGLIPPPLRNPIFTPMAFPGHLAPPPMNLSGPQFGEKPFNNVLSNLPSAISPTPPHPLLSPKLDELRSNPDKAPTPNHIQEPVVSPSSKLEKKNKEHKKDKKDKLKKRNKKDKVKNKAEKKKLKEEKKDKIKKEKKEKRKEKEQKDTDPGLRITLRLDKSPSPSPEVLEHRKLNIKPVIKKEEDVIVNNVDERKRETSPGLAKISALVCGPPKPKIVSSTPPQPAEDVAKEEAPVAPTPRTGPGPGRPRIHPIKPKPASKPKKRRSPVKKDALGNEVWICPGCGSQDDGSPMIGCDGCDAWYHWVCVGIQVPPDDNEDWYCRHCLLKKNEDLQSDKQKKKRKKREKKEH